VIKSSTDRPIFCSMIVNKQPVKLQVDCGATVNILPRRYIGDNEIRHEDVSLVMWNNDTLKALGKCRVKTVNPVTGDKWKVDYVVVDEELTPLLSRRAAEKMKLITVNYDNFESVRTVSAPSIESSSHTESPYLSTVPSSSTSTELTELFSDVFDGKLGALPGGKVDLTLAPNTEPVVRPARTLPESLNTTVKAELDRLEDSGVIIKVDKPTDWVNQMAETASSRRYTT